MGLFVPPVVAELLEVADPLTTLSGEQPGAHASSRACAQSAAGSSLHRPGTAGRFPPGNFVLSSSLLKLPLHLILLGINI